MTRASVPVRPLLPMSVDRMREAVLLGETRPLAWRLAQLDRLEAEIVFAR